MKLEEMIARFVQVSNGQVIDRTTMKIVQADLCHLNAWRKSFKRSFVDCTCWIPGKAEICNVSGRTALNLWRPPAMLDVPINWQDWAVLFKRHIDHMVRPPQQRPLTQWFAHMVQRPSQRPATAIVFKGSDATGFDALVQMIANALPDHSCLNTTESDYDGRLAGRLFATAINARDTSTKEPFWRRAVLEDYRKHGRHHHEVNCTRFMFFQSGAMPFRILGRELIEIDSALTAHPDYYPGLYANVIGKREFAASVQRYLMTVDISSFDHTALAPLPLLPPKARKPKAPRTESQNTWAFGNAGKRRKALDGTRNRLAAPLPGDADSPESPL